MKSVLLDAMFKYNGFGPLWWVICREPQRAITFNRKTLKAIMFFIGNGFDYQASYITKSSMNLSLDILPKMLGMILKL
jgi:hypothetical protein